MVTIPSGSFFLSEYIKNEIVAKNISKAELSYALELEMIDAVEYRFSTSKFQSDEWFNLAQILGETDKDIAFELATIYRIEDDITQTIYWYKKAVELEHTKALFELSDFYITLDELTTAKELLLPLKYQKQALDKLIPLSIALGDKTLSEKLISLIKNSDDNALLDDIQRYKIYPNQLTYSVKQQNINTATCRNNIQLFATNLANLRKLDKLISGISTHPIKQFICFNPPRYISIKQLNCAYEIDRAIKCDNTVWSSFQPEIDARYIGLLLDDGGANVDNGILYLDKYDGIGVFIHELSHLLGFVDEYALTPNHKVCQRVQDSPFSHNISVLKPFYKRSKKEVIALIEKHVSWFSLIDKETPLWEGVGDKLKIGTPHSFFLNNPNKIGLFKSETCDKTHLQAFKPTLNKTNLRYYENDFIPLYSMLLSKKKDVFLMPSYHYNVAKSLFRDNQDDLGLQWLNKALNKELYENEVINIVRYNKMKLGEY